MTSKNRFLGPSRFFSQAIGHIPTFVWLRYRISLNQMIKANWIGKLFAAISLAVLVMTGIGSLVIGIVAGIFLPRNLDASDYFVVWTGFMLVTTLLWLLYVLADIQRTDSITLDRIMHLPVSIGQAFVVNYVLSMVGAHTVSILFGVVGFVFGSCFSVGPRAILTLVPFACFFFAFSAVIYQFEGWFATLMANPRRRQTIMIMLPVAIIALTQIPAMVVHQFVKPPRSATVQPSPPAPIAEATESLKPTETDIQGESTSAQLSVQIPPALPSPGVETSQTDAPSPAPPVNSFDTPSPSPAPIEANVGDSKTTDRAISEEASNTESEVAGSDKKKPNAPRKSTKELIALARTPLQWINLLVPPLWVAACVDSIFAGNLNWLGLCGVMCGVAFASLRRNYKSTMRYYRGETDGRAAILGHTAALPQSELGQKAATGAEASTNKLVQSRYFELPFLSADTNAVMEMTWRSMRRAPEVKMFLLMPLLAPFVLLGVFRAWRFPALGEWQAITVVCFCGFNLLISAGLVGNQFGFDRAGFRAFVLSPIRRDRILMARNLATSPLLFFQIVLLVIALSLFAAMPLDKVVAALLLSISMLPTYYLLMNVMSILTPFPLAAGSIQPTQFGMGTFILNLGLSMVLPVIIGAAIVPLLLEWACDSWIEPLRGIPIAVALSPVWVATSFLLYGWLIPSVGKLMMKREQEILRIVTSKIE